MGTSRRTTHCNKPSMTPPISQGKTPVGGSTRLVCKTFPIEKEKNRIGLGPRGRARAAHGRQSERTARPRPAARQTDPRWSLRRSLESRPQFGGSVWQFGSRAVGLFRSTTRAPLRRGDLLARGVMLSGGVVAKLSARRGSTRGGSGVWVLCAVSAGEGGVFGCFGSSSSAHAAPVRV